MDLRRKEGSGARIPTSSMGDIAFLLIVFFMVTTIFKLEEDSPFSLPRTETGDKIPREKIAHIWIDESGNISIDDLIVGMNDVEPLVRTKLRENPALIIAFNTDVNTPYGTMDEAMEQLKRASALSVAFTTSLTEE
ncbi:biopolymer transporter ExbD [bacterium]|nr:biopolymer transporter ExbD [bacterium]